MSEIPEDQSHLSTNDAPVQVPTARITRLDYLRAWLRGIAKADYAKARRAGATHAQVMEANASAGKIGVPRKQMLEVCAKGIDVDSYGFALGHGYWWDPSHAEILEAHAKGIDVRDYAVARTRATHAEVLEAHAKGIDVRGYAEARFYRATHTEVLEAHAKGIDAANYAYALRIGLSAVSHAEVLEAHAKDVDLGDYAHLRYYVGSSTHEEALEVCLKGVPWYEYYVRRYHLGASHAEAVEALLTSTDREDLDG